MGGTGRMGKRVADAYRADDLRQTVEWRRREAVRTVEGSEALPAHNVIASLRRLLPSIARTVA
jgi:hypothetical protein